MKKVLKIIGIVVLVLVGLPLLIAAFTAKEYAVEREITIAQPREVVFEYVKLLKNQDNYSVWAAMDPAMKKEFKGIDGTVGFVSGWDSDNPDVGRGEQEIIKITEGERLDFELRFYEPFEATDNAYMITENASGGGTTVKWGFNGKMAYPMNIMLVFMDMDGMLGKDLDAGLTNLKKVLEG